MDTSSTAAAVGWSRDSKARRRERAQLACRPGRSGLVAQLALVPLALAGPLSARLTGQDYLLEVAPVDPIDPFRGAYVALAYPGLPSSQQLTAREDDGRDVAYVPLVPSGELWTGLRPVAEPPVSGPFLRCKNDHWRLRCGIDSWFLPQEEAAAMEQAVGEGSAVARVRIDARGNAALIDVEIRGEDGR